MMSRRPSTSVRPLRFQHLQRRDDLALEAQRLLVDEEQVGPKAQRRLPDDRGAHFHRLVERDVQAERLVLAVGELDHARDAHEVDARAEIEAADDRRARQDQHRHALEPVDQRVRDRAAAAQVAEAEAVVAVDEDPRVVESFHVTLCVIGRTRVRRQLGGRIVVGHRYALRKTLVLRHLGARQAKRAILPHFAGPPVNPAAAGPRLPKSCQPRNRGKSRTRGDRERAKRRPNAR